MAFPLANIIKNIAQLFLGETVKKVAKKANYRAKCHNKCHKILISYNLASLLNQFNLIHNTKNLLHCNSLFSEWQILCVDKVIKHNYAKT